VVLAPRDAAGLAEIASAVSTPGSTAYRHFWTPAEILDTFGPLPSTVEAVSSVLRSDGFNIVGVSADRSIVSVTGTIGEIDASLDASMHSVRLASGRMAIANGAAPKLPSNVAPAVQGIVGLNTIAQIPNPLPPVAQGTPSGSSGVAASIAGAPATCAAAVSAANGSGSYTADQLAHAYSLDGLWAKGDLGAGVTMAVFELGEVYNPTDLSQFQSCYKTGTTITPKSVDAQAVTGSPGDGEFTLDLETIIGAAPKVKLLAYDAPEPSGPLASGFPYWLDEEKKIVTDDLASVVSESYGVCEAVTDEVDAPFVAAESTNFEQAALEGQAWMISTGDAGSQGCAQLFSPFEDSYDGGSYRPDHGIAVDAATHTSYVVSTADDTIAVIDDETGATVETLLVSYNSASGTPQAIAVDPTSGEVIFNFVQASTLYVSKFPVSSCNAEGCSISSVPGLAKEGASVAALSAAVPSRASGAAGSRSNSDVLTVHESDIVVNPATSTIYMSNTDSNGVYMFNETTMTYVAPLQYAQSGAAPGGGAALWEPAAMAVDPTSGGDLYVSDLGGGSLFVISAGSCNATTQSACGTATATPLVNSTTQTRLVASTLVVGKTSGVTKVLAAVESATGTSPQVDVLTRIGSLSKTIGLSSYISATTGLAWQINTALSPDGAELLVAGYPAKKYNQGIIVIPLSKLAITADIQVDYCYVSLSSSCYLGFMGSDPTTGTVVVDAAQVYSSSVVEFLADAPLDAPIGMLSPQNPSTQPYVTAVGGTSLKKIGPAPTESVWNNALIGGGAGTGGVSANWTMPTWQRGTGVISSLSSGSACGAASGSYCREVPDVSADADPYTGYVLYLDGGWTGGEGGTSAASPLFASTIALAEASLSPAPRFGFLDPTLYTLAASGHGFDDVTTGNNDNLGTAGGAFPATAGYDMATGLGSPIATTLTAGLTATPKAPTGVTAIAGHASAQVSWKAPTAIPFLPITGYAVIPYLGTVAQTASTFKTTATTDKVTGLTAGKAYTFKVAAINAAGRGASSASSGAVVPYTVPGAPTGVTAKAGKDSATVHWVDPVSNGFSAITSYKATAYVGSTPQPNPCTVKGAAATSCVVTGLTPGKTYTFRVVAINAAGSGAASAASGAVVPYTNPGVPSGVAASAGKDSATVHWVDPDSNGFSAITSYKATAYIASTPQAKSCTALGPKAVTCVVSGLTAGTSYSFKVVAINAAGSGAASASSGAVVPYTVPGAPTGVTATAGKDSATVHWVDPASNGFSVITSYKATAYVGSAAQANSCTVKGATATSCVVTGLTAGKAYTFKVVAINAAGGGPASSPSATVSPHSDLTYDRR
jgi:predicted RNA-binding protein with TRAM domain